MIMIKFTAEINPMGAVRMTQRSKWTSPAAQRYLSYKRVLGYAARQKITEPSKNAIEVRVWFFYPIPKRFNKQQQLDAHHGEIRPIVKPDLDNCVKAVFDALNGIAWNDDNQVVEVTSEKWYGKVPRVEVEIKEVGA